MARDNATLICPGKSAVQATVSRNALIHSYGPVRRYSGVIIDTIKGVQSTKDEILVVDLREGNAWIPPNLYFLASLAVERTSVRQIDFVETRHVEEVFLGMCFPEDLKKTLAQKVRSRRESKGVFRFLVRVFRIPVTWDYRACFWVYRHSTMGDLILHGS